MAALMSRDDFEASSDSETQHGNKGILESDAVYVIVTGATDKLACDLVASEEKIKNMRIDSGARLNLLGSTSPFGFGRWFDIVANEPPAEPARCDFLNRKEWTSCQGSRYRWKIHFVGGAQVLKTLHNAPRAFTRLPVELEWSKPLDQLFGALIGGIQFGNESHRPRSRWRINSGGHTIKFTGLSFGDVTLQAGQQSIHYSPGGEHEQPTSTEPYRNCEPLRANRNRRACPGLRRCGQGTRLVMRGVRLFGALAGGETRWRRHARSAL